MNEINKKLLSTTYLYSVEDIENEYSAYKNELTNLYDFLDNNIEKILHDEFTPDDDCTITFTSFRRFSIPTIDTALDKYNCLYFESQNDDDKIKNYKFVRVKNSILRNADPDDPYFMYRISIVKRQPEERYSVDEIQNHINGFYKATKLYRMASSVEDTILYTDMNSLYTQKELGLISMICNNETNHCASLCRSLEPNEFGKYRYYAYSNKNAELALYKETL